MDEPYEKRERSPSVARMSKVPSWISVGFVLGLFAGWALKPAPPGTVRTVEVVRPAPPPTRLGTVEAMFDAWRAYASWDDDDFTEIAVWNAESGEFVEFFEVKRINHLYYFRNIAKLTRPLSRKPLPKDCPLQFTDPWARVSAAVELVSTPGVPAGRSPKSGARFAPPLPAPQLPAAPKIEPPQIELPPVTPEKR